LLSPQWREGRVAFLQSCGDEFKRLQEARGKSVFCAKPALPFVADYYQSHVHPQLADTLENPDHLIDRHKIIAGLTLSIMECWPFVSAPDLGEREWNPDQIPPRRTCRLNAEFAAYVGMMVLERWSKHNGGSFRPMPGAKPFLDDYTRFLAGNPVISPSQTSQSWYLLERVCVVEAGHEASACSIADGCGNRVPMGLPSFSPARSTTVA
jgi:hypothetical protein